MAHQNHHSQSILRFLVATLALGSFCALSSATVFADNNSDKSKVHTSTTTVITQESEQDATPTPTATPGMDRDYLVEKVFGSKAQSGIDGCKTDDLAEKAKRELDRECKSWMKEQKSELGHKYQTGTCNDECEDCGTSLKRCKVRGTVHYAK